MIINLIYAPGAFLDAIETMEFDYVASGHYAHIVHPPSDQKEASILKLSNDMVKKIILNFIIYLYHSVSFCFFLSQ